MLLEAADRDGKKPHSPYLPHHRTYGARIRRYDDWNSCRGARQATAKFTKKRNGNALAKAGVFDDLDGSCADMQAFHPLRIDRPACAVPNSQLVASSSRDGKAACAALTCRCRTGNLDWMDSSYAKVRALLPSRRTFFEHLRALLQYLPFDDWDHLMRFMQQRLAPNSPDTS